MYNKEKSEQKKKYKCPGCAKTYTARQNLHRHILEVCSEAPAAYSCSVCSKTFSRKDNYIRHSNKKTKCDSKPSKICAICKAEFKSPWLLKRHIKSHETDSCDLCCPKCKK